MATRTVSIHAQSYSILSAHDPGLFKVGDGQETRKQPPLEVRITQLAPMDVWNGIGSRLIIDFANRSSGIHHLFDTMVEAHCCVRDKGTT